MGYSFIGIISNELSPDEIITLPEKLNIAKPLQTPEEDWKWVMEVSPDFLSNFWLRTEQWYQDQLRDQKFDEIYRYPSIECGWWDIYFQEAQITLINFPFKNSPGTLDAIDTEPEMIPFLNAAKRVAKILRAKKMVLSYEIDLEYGTFDNLLDSFTKANRGFKVVDI